MIPTGVPPAPWWPEACEVGPCAGPAAYTVAVEDSIDREASAVIATRQSCGFHLQDAVDEALEFDVPAGVVDADRYLTDAERRITVARWLA